MGPGPLGHDWRYDYSSRGWALDQGPRRCKPIRGPASGLTLARFRCALCGSAVAVLRARGLKRSGTRAPPNLAEVLLADRNLAAVTECALTVCARVMES